MKRTIHTTPEEIMAQNSETLISSIENLIIRSEENARKIINTLDRTNNIRKLDEIKSASLITNQELKKIAKNEKVKLQNGNVEIVTVKGEDGKTPKKGVDYYTPEEIDEIKKEITPKKGIDYNDGESIAGPQGPKGADGSPDSPDEIIEKINVAKKKISWKQIKDAPNMPSFDTMNQTGYASGGANQLRLLSSGSVISDHVTELNFSTGLTPTYSGNGRITITSSGGGGSSGYSIETPTGSVNGSNTTYTVTQTPVYIVADGAVYFDGAGYTIAGLTVTMTVAPSSFIRSFYGGSGTTVETPSGTVNGSNTSFTATATPLYVVSDGAMYFEGAGYTIVGLAITMTVAPSSFIRIFRN